MIGSLPELCQTAAPLLLPRFLHQPDCAGGISVSVKMASDWQPTDAKSEASRLDVAVLIGAIAGGDKVAFSALFTHFAPRVKGMLMRSGLEASRADEIAQETMLTVWRKAAMFDPAGASAPAWIFTIARNLRIDALRRDQRSKQLYDAFEHQPSVDASSPADDLTVAEIELRVRGALVGLSQEQRDVVTLSFFENKAHSQIAKSLSIPLGTVKSRLRLAMKHLRDSLDDFS